MFSEEKTTKINVDTAPFEKVLSEKFVRGFVIGSHLDMKKFRRYYEELNGEELKFSDEDMEAVIFACGICCDNKVFAPAAMLSDELRNKLFLFIRESFSEGKQVIYYEALFQAFSEDFLDYYIYSADMLKAYLKYYNDSEFHMGDRYISKDTSVQASLLDEVRNYLIAVGRPVDSAEICKALSHIPQKKIMQILGMNGEFVNNGKNCYFHVNIVHISKEEIENIACLIGKEIEEKEFLSGNELIEMIRIRYPMIIEDNLAISMIGLRDLLKHYLKKRFSFKGNIISDIDKAISMADVFGDYAKNYPEFTLAELTTLATELNTTVYFEAVYDNSLRISRERFVSKDMAHFLVKETDRAIDRFCSGKYIAIGKVTGFGSFPDAGFPWNIYLLEHYVYAYSKGYRLYHAGFNRDCCVGAIVKINSGIETFDDLLVMALAESDIVLGRDNALSFLVAEGYLARRKYANIEKVLIQANTHRNRKGTK